MSLSYETRMLIDFADSIELYAHRNRIIIRLEMDDYEAARILCRHAVAQCSEIAESVSSGPRRTTHEENCARIRLLEAMITEAQLRCEQGAHVTTAF